MSVTFLLIIWNHVSGAEPEAKDVIPEYTRSPNGRYGFTVPVFDFEAIGRDYPRNTLIEISSGRVLTTIRAGTGYDRSLNYIRTLPSRWSTDSSLVLWTVEGKWEPTALVLLQLKHGKVSWYRDLPSLVRKPLLLRLRRSKQGEYLAAKDEPLVINAEVFTPLAFPVLLRAYLEFNPKQIQGRPWLKAHLDAAIDARGRLQVNDFGIDAAEIVKSDDLE